MSEKSGGSRTMIAATSNARQSVAETPAAHRHTRISAHNSASPEILRGTPAAGLWMLTVLLHPGAGSTGRRHPLVLGYDRRAVPPAIPGRPRTRAPAPEWPGAQFLESHLG